MCVCVCVAAATAGKRVVIIGTSFIGKLHYGMYYYWTGSNQGGRGTIYGNMLLVINYLPHIITNNSSSISTMASQMISCLFMELNY